MSIEEKQLGPINKVCVVGLGYIGLPTAAFIADSGISVVGWTSMSAMWRRSTMVKCPFLNLASKLY